MKKSFVIVGTDTGVGKTVISAGLFLSFLKKGYRTVVQKWVSTGDVFGFSEDVRFCFDICGIDRISDFFPTLLEEDVNPYSFVYPASPHYSAYVHRKKIDVGKIKRSWRRLNELFDMVIVEGVGGVLVPIKEDILLIDIVRELEIPVVVVIKNVLGGINHSLLTIEAIRRRGIDIVGLVFNDAFDTSMDIKKDNIKTILRYSGERYLGVIPYMSDIKDFLDVFHNITSEIEEVFFGESTPV